MDDLGFVFTIDVMLAIILIVVILGYSADSMDITENKIHSYVSEESFQRALGDITDTLIKTPGNPENWENNKNLISATPGLAKINDHRVVANTLSMNKILALKNNPDMMGRMIPEGMGCNLIIYPVDPSLPAIPVINKRIPKTSSDVYTVNRTILCDYERIQVYARVNMGTVKNSEEIKNFVCPHTFLNYNKHERPDFTIKKSGWICVPFNIKQEDLHTKELYLITDPPLVRDCYAEWLINRPDDLTGSMQKFIQSPLKINDRLSKVLGNDLDAILVLHIRFSGDPIKTFNVYLIGVEPGTSDENLKAKYIEPEPAYFIFKMWI